MTTRTDDERPFSAGQPIDDEALRAAILGGLRDAAAALDDGVLPVPEVVRDFDAADESIGLAVRELGAVLAPPADADGAGQDGRASPSAAHALGCLFDLQRAVDGARLEHRSRALARVQDALAAMHAVETVAELIELIPAQICRCGFDRAILSRVHERQWVAESVYVEGDPAWAAEILAVGRSHPQDLSGRIIEAELVRRRHTLVVHDVQNDRRAHRPIAEASRSRSYVAAPIMPEGRAIGFLHADCYGSAREVDAFDAEVLQVLADGVGLVLERTAQSERLAALRGEVRGLTQRISSALDEVAEAEVELARLESLPGPRAHGWTSELLEGTGSRLERLLTRREVEIMRLLAGGATNREIADRLVIAQATVRSHIRHILRKLGVANRAGAVSRFMKLLGDNAAS